jgi:peptidyl-dipeptidase A
MATKSPNQLLEEVSAGFRSAEADFHRAYWVSQIEATAENDRRREDLELVVRQLKGDKSVYAAVAAALEEEVHDPVVKRQLQILHLSLTANQMDEKDRGELVRLASAVESDFASFRPRVGGSFLNDNQIEEILRTSDDVAKRQEAWVASKEVGHKVGESVRELVRLRNKVARDLGFTDYYRMSLELQELTEEWLFERLDELDQVTAEPFARWKEGVDRSLTERFDAAELRPWHYADPFFQHAPPEGRITLDRLFDGASAPDLAHRTFAAWGIDLASVMEASDLYPRDLKCQHAFCLDFDRSGDIRILANVVPGERWVEVMLHESGHAAYDSAIDPDLPWVLRRAAHTFVTEAIAILSGDLVRDPEWLIQIAGMPSAEVSEMAQALHDARAAQKLSFVRWGLLMCHFERDLYSDPEVDLDGRWWELVERFQSVSAPPEPPPGAWASKIHLAVAPVYYQNYLLGEMLAAQLRATIKNTSGQLIGNSAAGRFLVDRVFRHGQLLRWESLIESATGAPLSPSAFAALL